MEKSVDKQNTGIFRPVKEDRSNGKTLFVYIYKFAENGFSKRIGLWRRIEKTTFATINLYKQTV